VLPGSAAERIYAERSGRASFEVRRGDRQGHPVSGGRRAVDGQAQDNGRRRGRFFRQNKFHSARPPRGGQDQPGRETVGQIAEVGRDPLREIGGISAGQSDDDVAADEVFPVEGPGVVQGQVGRRGGGPGSRVPVGMVLEGHLVQDFPGQRRIGAAGRDLFQGFYLDGFDPFEILLPEPGVEEHFAENPVEALQVFLGHGGRNGRRLQVQL
jgi:hypothetical protein